MSLGELAARFSAGHHIAALFADRAAHLAAGRLANPNFSDKAQASVVAECKANLAEAEAQAELARRRLAELG